MKNSAIIQVIYAGKKIRVKKEKNVFIVSATDIGKIYDYKLDQFLKSDEGSNIVKIISLENKIRVTELYFARKSREAVGTWMHELLAVHYANSIDSTFGE